jgi:hypothetical protein
MSDEAKLLVRIEASAAKLESAMNKAAGIVKTKMDAIDNRVSGSNKAVTDGLQRQGAAMIKAQGATNSTRFAVQNAAFQFQDFAVQVASGTSATRAFAQQAPQLLSAFGLFGVLAGTAAAALIPLAANLFATGEEVKKIDALSLEGVRGRVGELLDLQAQYTEAVRVHGIVQSEVSERAVQAVGVEYGAKLALFKLEAITLEQRKRQLEASIAAQKAQIDELAASMELLNDPDQNSAAYVRTQQQSAQIEQLQTMIAQNESVFLEIQRQNAELDLVNLSLAEAQGLLGGGIGMADGLANSLGGAAVQAGALAANLAAAMAAANAIPGMANPDPNAPIDYDREAAATQNQLAGIKYKQRLAAAKGGGGGGGGGGAPELTDDQKAAKKWIEETRTELERYNTEQAELNGLLKSGAIDADTHARAMEMIGEKYGQLGSMASILESGIDGISGALADALVNGGSLRDGLAQVFGQIAGDLAKSGIKELLSGLFDGAGGGGGGLLGDLFGGIFGGARARGGPVQSGKAYLVGERGPELFAPGRNGSIIPNNRMNSGGGGGNVRLEIVENDMFASRVDAQATGVAVAVQKAAQRKALPDAMMKVQQNPRVRV